MQIQLNGSMDGLFMYVSSAALNTPNSGVYSVFFPPGHSDLYRLQRTRLLDSFYIEACNLASVRIILNAASRSGYCASFRTVDKNDYRALLSHGTVSRVTSQLWASFKSGSRLYRGDACFVESINTDKIVTV